MSIRYDNGPDFFPQSWLEKPISAKAVPLEKSELPRMAQIILTSLEKYSIQSGISEDLFSQKTGIRKYKHD